MATYWNKTASGYNNSTYCYGYYQGQQYGANTYVYSNVGDSSGGWTVSGTTYVISGSGYDWACYDNGVYLKIGNSSGGYGWKSVNAKRVYTYYCDSEADFEYETYVSFYWTNSTVDTTIKGYGDIGLTPPTGKKFKEWNTSADGTGTSYSPNDIITDSAGDINFRYKSIKLYAIWEWDGLGNIGGKKALCYICDGHDENNNPIWKQVLPYAYIRNSENVLDWRLGVGGSS